MAGRAPLRALILGGASCVWEDEAAARDLFTPDVVIACNHAARDYPGRFDHWITMHPELRPKWIAARERAGLEPAGKLWHPRHRGPAENSTPIESWGGSSGMLCVALGYELRCSHIVLAGVPMTKTPHFDDPKPWREARQYHNVWLRHLHRIKSRTRSMSGWTREQLGAPTKEWLDGIPD